MKHVKASISAIAYRKSSLDRCGGHVRLIASVFMSGKDLIMPF